jgi:hypothetical protein
VDGTEQETQGGKPDSEPEPDVTNGSTVYFGESRVSSVDSACMKCSWTLNMDNISVTCTAPAGVAVPADAALLTLLTVSNLNSTTWNWVRLDAEAQN